MEILLYSIIALAALILLLFLFFKSQKKKTISIYPLDDTGRKILEEQVPFYQKLNEAQKKEFEDRMQLFLARVRITGINTNVEATDRVLVAASAIIPIFGFPGWEYTNLNEVLLYPDSFGEEFSQEGPHRNTVGMVGTGAMNNVMILSQFELRQAFINKTGKNNVAIHEFVHLVDKTDGSIDGVPEVFADRKYVVPWLELMHKNIRSIIDDRSDINPYGATNEAEFFAVAAEYFFERPDLLRSKHPELFNLLAALFRQQPLQ